MAPHQRMDEYRRRRQKTARRRRGTPHRRPRRPAFPREVAPASCSFENGLAEAFRDALRELALKACSYRAVTGLLYRCCGDRVSIQVVAPHPMTNPLRFVATTWREQLEDTHPGVTWSLRVSSVPPEPTDHYHCLYWCQH